MAVQEPKGMIFDSVIFASDFSPYSENAGRYALRLAEYFSAGLFVIHSFLPTQAAIEAEAYSQADSTQRKDLRQQLERAVKDLTRDSANTTVALLDGAPQKAIAKFADAHSRSILVLGTHGRGRVERALIGSTAEDILRSTAIPTLTVGPHVPAADPGTLPFRHILCATDLSPAAERGIAIALQLTKLSNGTLDVLHVIPKDGERSAETPEEMVRRLCSSVEHLDAAGAQQLCSPQAFVEEGKVHERIMDHLRQDAMDLLILGVRKSSEMSFLARSTGAFRIITDAPCPVLTVTG